MKINNILIGIGLFILLMVMPIVLADSSGGLLTGKAGECINLPQECASCTYVKLTTVTIPNMSQISFQTNMNQDGTSYSYSFCNTTDIGTYSYCMVGDVDGTDTVVCKDFSITYAGFNQTTAQGLGSVSYIALMVALTILFGYMGFRLSDSGKLWILGIFFLFFSVMLMVYDVWLGYEYNRYFTGLANNSTPEIIFYIFMIIIVAGFAGAIVMLILRWKEYARKIKQEIKADKEDKWIEDWENS